MSTKLTIEAIEILDTISRKGSFAAAADALYKVPSALTYQMGKLEKDLGIAIFNREGYRTTLTEAGEALLKEGRQLLDMAQAVESHVKKVATGIESNIVIAVNDLLAVESIYPVLDDFYRQGFGTRVKIIKEVFGGTWDAIGTGRADIAIGAPGEPPMGGGYLTQAMGNTELVFCVASNHPLANMPEPLKNEDIIQHRAIVAADSSRDLPPRSAGILTGQDCLNVPDMQTKISAQVAGLGVGNLPKHVAAHYMAKGQMVIKQTASPSTIVSMHIAWPATMQKTMGQAQSWLLKAFGKLELSTLLLH